MLSTLHSTLHDKHAGIFHYRHHVPIFRFLIVSENAQIRFFFEVEKKYQAFLESQLYAHYSDIEIRVTDWHIDPTQEFEIQEASLAHIQGETLKLYANLKDKTEKEAIDPLSSITSALSKYPRNDTCFIRVDFTPMRDEAWKV